MPLCATGRARTRTPFRRGVPSARPHERAILAHDVVEQGPPARHGRGRSTIGHGPHDAHRGAQIASAPRPGDVTADEKDKRSRRLILTPAGRSLLARAYPLWKAAYAEIEQKLVPSDPGRLRTDLTLIVQHLNNDRWRQI